MTVKRSIPLARRMRSWTRWLCRRHRNRPCDTFDPTLLEEPAHPNFGVAPPVCMELFFCSLWTLFLENHIAPPVLCASLFGVVAGDRLIFAETDARHAIRGHARRDQRVSH